MVATQSSTESGGGNVSVATDGAVTRVWLGGVLDAVTVPEVRPALDVLVQRKPAQVVLDLSRLRIIDGHGVRALAQLYSRLHADGCALTVTGAEQQPLAMLKLFQLDRVLSGPASQ